MVLVNDTDVNRENIDKYLNQLQHLSSNQQSLLSTLREVSAGVDYVLMVSCVLCQLRKTNLIFCL